MSAAQEDGQPKVPGWHKELNIRFLSHLKFVGVKPLASDGYPEEKGEKASTAAYVTQDPAQYQGETGTSRAGRAFGRQHRYDKLASDKPGEELAPDSSIWRLYAEEAKEHDRDLVERRNKNLDTMLLFAGLFSAILTAFLVESTNLLEPDLAETSVALLLDIAQSQRSAGNGAQINPLPPIELPAFQPSASARWINALWFMALALSLGAAMMAMLAKEWLEEFIAAAPTHPHEYARERQSRLDALMSWNTLRIVDFLPTLLHFSLVLFTLGLIMHLWHLDQIVALILAVVSAGLFVCYSTIVILGAVRDECPYRTRVSKYLKKILDKCGSKDSSKLPKEDSPIAGPGRKEETTLADMRALEWLTAEARDPPIGDSAYQALAGLRTRPLNVLEGNKTVLRMGLEIVERLRTARLSYPRELAFCRGTNVARYASALPEIYQYASQIHRHPAIKDTKSQDLVEHLAMVDDVQKSAFKALDMIWSDDCPPFTADAYAELTAAELRLTGFVADEVKAGQDSTNSGQETDKASLNSSPHASVPILTESGSNMQEHGSQCWSIPWRSGVRPICEPSKAVSGGLSDLQARYSRALCRAAFQLAFHSNGRAPIGSYALINLLGAISELSKKDALDSKKYMITHYPQYQNDSATTIYAFIPADTGYHTLAPADIGHEDGLLAGLTNILGSNSLKAVPKLETAAMKSIASIAPKLIKQWVGLRHGLVQPNFTAQTDLAKYASELDYNWTIFDYDTVGDLHPSTRAEFIITYLIKIATFAMSFFRYEGVRQLPEISIRALYTGVEARASAETWDSAWWTIAGECTLLKQWIESIGRAGISYPHGRVWAKESKAYLLRLLAFRNRKERSILLELLAGVKNDEDAQEVFLAVLETMAEVAGEVGEIEILLEAIWSSICSEDTGRRYSECFTHTPDGFDALRGVGSHPKHTDHVSAAIANLVIFLAQQDGKQIESDVVPSFLETVSFVCKHPPPDRLGDAPLRTFLSRVAVSLQGLLESITSTTEDSLVVLLHRTLDELIQTSEGVNEQKPKKSFQRSREAVGKEEMRRQEASRQSSRIAGTVPPTLDHRTGGVGKGEGEGEEGDGAPSSAVNDSEEVRSKDDMQLGEDSAKPA